ncbi:MAG: molecular chaperone HtpG [Saprospiraceae bacterium]|nr:molecular chaperone HtpG [Saprospiraceae bacterium]
MATGKISVQTENIFPIIKKFLYSDHEIFLRELISNAVDATSKLKTLSHKGDYDGELGDLTIDVILDKEAGTLTIKDQGIGMSEAEVKKFLNQVAFSSAESFIKKYQDDAQIIGHFGLGFYSSFMVADKVEVITKTYKKSPSAVKWTCTGDPEYTIENHPKKERGTEVVLHISDDSKEFLEENRIEALLKKYCKFLPYPIRFGQKTEYKTVGEGEDAEQEAIEVDNIINNTDPAWKKKPSKLKEADYKAFYNELYPYSEPPLFWIHLNIDYPFNLTGILYFPKITNNFEVQKNKIHLYSNQVFITDEVKEIVPEFLTLLHGVIDSPDIPLNVSRSYLQSDHNVKKITGYITKKVADKLKSTFKKDREKYESNWPEVGTFVKYGLISDEKFGDKAKDFLLFKTTDSNYFTLEEYKDKVKDQQTDKDGKLVFIYTNDPTQHHGYIEAVRDKGYDVLEMDNIIDNHLMQHLEYKGQEYRFVRVDSETPDRLINKEEERDSVLSDQQVEKVKSMFVSVLGEEKEKKIETKALSPDDHPVMITKPEFLRRMSEMQKLQGGPMAAGDDDFYNIIVNTNHPLVADKLVKMRSEEKKEKFAKYLYDLARLNQNMLKGKDLTGFIQESIDLMQ